MPIKLSSQSIHFSKKLVFAFFLCILSFFYIKYLYATIEYPFFFFSDQHNHFYPLAGLQKNIFYPSVAGARFTPLAMAEFYPLLTSHLPLEKIMRCMYYLQALKILLIFISLFLSMRILSTSFIALTLSFLFCIMAQHVGFYSLISMTQCCEAVIATLFLLFFLLYILAQKKNNSILYIICLCLVCIMTYYKEPVFGIFIVFAFFQYIDYRPYKTTKEKIFLLLLLVNGVIFCTLYYIYSYVPGPNYATGRVTLSTNGLIKSIFQQMPLYYIAVIILCARCIYFIKQKKIKIYLPDTLLLCALSWLSAYVILHLNAAYYFIPSYIILFLAFAGYLNQLQSIFFRCSRKFYYTFIGICSISIIICIAIFPKISATFDDQLSNKLRISTTPILILLHDLQQLQHQRYNFLPPPQEFETPFNSQVANWFAYTIEAFYNMYFHGPLPQEVGITNAYFGSEFMSKLDQGGVGLFAPLTTISPFPWQNNTQYSQLSLDFMNIVYNKTIERDINTAYCKMVNTLYESAGPKFSKFFPVQEAQASIRGCIHNNGQPFTPASRKNLQESSTIEEALAH